MMSSNNELITAARRLCLHADGPNWSDMTGRKQHFDTIATLIWTNVICMEIRDTKQTCSNTWGSVYQIWVTVSICDEICKPGPLKLFPDSFKYNEAIVQTRVAHNEHVLYLGYQCIARLGICSRWVISQCDRAPDALWVKVDTRKHPAQRSGMLKQ